MRPMRVAPIAPPARAPIPMAIMAMGFMEDSEGELDVSFRTLDVSFRTLDVSFELETSG
jgi:hypothetical protein